MPISTASPPRLSRYPLLFSVFRHGLHQTRTPARLCHLHRRSGLRHAAGGASEIIGIARGSGAGAGAGGGTGSDCWTTRLDHRLLTKPGQLSGRGGKLGFQRRTDVDPRIDHRLRPEALLVALGAVVTLLALIALEFMFRAGLIGPLLKPALLLLRTVLVLAVFLLTIFVRPILVLAIFVLTILLWALFLAGLDRQLILLVAVELAALVIRALLALAGIIAAAGAGNCPARRPAGRRLAGSAAPAPG